MLTPEQRIQLRDVLEYREMISESSDMQRWSPNERKDVAEDFLRLQTRENWLEYFCDATEHYDAEDMTIYLASPVLNTDLLSYVEKCLEADICDIISMYRE